MASIYAYLLEHKKLPQDWFWEVGGGGGSATALPQGNTKIAFSSKSA